MVMFHKLTEIPHSGGRMVETPEGISSLKFSLERDIHGAMNLMKGKTKVATFTIVGEEHKHLLVTAPQLWEACNDFLRATLAEDVIKSEQVMKNLVAKCVNKDSWSQVNQS